MDEERGSSSTPKLIKSCFVDKPHVLLIDSYAYDLERTAQTFEAESWAVTTTSTIKDGLKILENREGVPNKMPKIGLVCMSIPRGRAEWMRTGHLFGRSSIVCNRQKGENFGCRGAIANTFCAPDKLLDKIKRVAAATKDVPFVILTSYHLESNSNSWKVFKEAGALWNITKPVIESDVIGLMKIMDLEPYNVLEFDEPKKKRTRKNPRTLNIG